MSARLKSLGFIVVLRREATRKKILDAFKEFTDLGKFEPERDRIVFFSGHGLQEEGETYLVPTGEVFGETEDWAVSLGRLTKRLNKLPGRHIFILDCCRYDQKDEAFKKNNSGELPIFKSPELPAGSKAAQFLFLMGCDPGAEAIAGGKGKLSILTEAVLEKFHKGAGVISICPEIVGLVKTLSKGEQRAWFNSSFESECVL
eukprot:gb/GEZN01008599.1/.p1 GENE.gb/GEZN01008599.1/~~gb/GEZN01008599.1/.p1  ORF type:complete len:202 (+),score=17.93 gb/GEZN01008599.1/:167-772(+)